MNVYSPSLSTITVERTTHVYYFSWQFQFEAWRRKWWLHTITYLHGLPQRRIKLCLNLVELQRTRNMKTRVKSFYYQTWSLLRTRKGIYLYQRKGISTTFYWTPRDISFYYGEIKEKYFALFLVLKKRWRNYQSM